METHLHVVSAVQGRDGKPDIDTPTIDSTRLLNGRRELMIRHGASTYRLRVTASEKLILTK